MAKHRPGAANVGASIIVDFAVVSNDSYVPHNWHIVTLTVFGHRLQYLARQEAARY